MDAGEQKDSIPTVNGNNGPAGSNSPNSNINRNTVLNNGDEIKEMGSSEELLKAQSPQNASYTHHLKPIKAH